MATATRRSGMTLLVLGLLGMAFFWATDPHFGPAVNRLADPAVRVDWHHWLFVLRGSPDNAVDAANQALTGTIMGFAGSVVVVLVSLWLLTRRRV